MIQRGFLTRKNKRGSKNTPNIPFPINFMLYLGIIIIIAALIYLIANFSKADLIASTWLPFMIAGVFMVFMSQIIKWRNARVER
jgi:hypothetical protein